MEQYFFNSYPTLVEYFGEVNNNRIYVKRDDCTKRTLGGNKVRKLELFLKDAQKKQVNYIVTYGSAQSNHCRLTVMMAKKLGFQVLLILAKSENVDYNGNFLIYDLYDTEIVWTETNVVPETIDNTMDLLKKRGEKPYFIQGGGHGNLGTHAYKIAFDEIIKQEKQIKINFNYIFHASGTGTTQAGLVVGNKVHETEKEIIGLSVARNNQRGLEVINESVQSYLTEYYPNYIDNKYDINFIDKYVGNGYADIYPEVIDTIKYVAKQSSILLDPVYTGKAFFGMLDIIKNQNIQQKNILFIHTGGIPLLFNYADKFKERIQK